MFKRTQIRSTILVLVVGVSVALVGCRKQNPAQKLDFAAAVKATNPLAYFRLETINGSSETGSSIYVSQGGVTGSGSAAPIGMDGNKCVVLDGKDGWIKSGLMGGIKTAGTIMVWVKLDALPKEVHRWFYVAGESQEGNDFDVEFGMDNDLRFYTATGGHSTYSPNPKTLVDQWHMIVATIDYASGSRTMFWDGQPVAVDHDASHPKNTTTVFTIGASPVWTGRNFGGSVDEVAVWERALSASEIAELYAAAK